MDPVLHISRDDLYQPGVDSTLAHAKAVLQHAQPIPEEHVSTLRRVLLSHMFFTPFAGLLGGFTTWLIMEPWLDDQSVNTVAFLLTTPLLAALIVLFIFVGDALSSRRLRGNGVRWASGIGFTLLFAIVSFIPMGIILQLRLAMPDPPSI